MEPSRSAMEKPIDILESMARTPQLVNSPPPPEIDHPMSPANYDSENEPLVASQPSLEVAHLNSRRSSQRSTDTFAASQLGKTLTRSDVFYDIPMSDAFSELLEQTSTPHDQPTRTNASAMEDDDRVGGEKSTLNFLVIGKMWRSMARYAKQKLVQTAPDNMEAILKLWHIRLLALTKLGLYQLASAELDKLGDLNRPEFRRSPDGHSLVSIELWILWARLPAWMKHPLVSLERITMLAIHCKKMQYQDEALWKQREIQVYIVLASQMIEMDDFKGATTIMKMVREHFVPNNRDVISALTRLYIQLGDFGMAALSHEDIGLLSSHDEQPLITESICADRALLYMAKGNWAKAAAELQKAIDSNKDDLVSIHNLAVCEIYQGNVTKAISLLENLTLQSQTSAGACSTLLQNLAILYELRYENATEKKISLLKQSADWVGDAFPPECFRLQQ